MPVPVCTALYRADRYSGAESVPVCTDPCGTYEVPVCTLQPRVTQRHSKVSRTWGTDGWDGAETVEDLKKHVGKFWKNIFLYFRAILTLFPLYFGPKTAKMACA